MEYHAYDPLLCSESGTLSILKKLGRDQPNSEDLDFDDYIDLEDAKFHVSQTAKEKRSAAYEFGWNRQVKESLGPLYEGLDLDGLEPLMYEVDDLGSVLIMYDNSDKSFWGWCPGIPDHSDKPLIRLGFKWTDIFWKWPSSNFIFHGPQI
jgi:hypothetical protein